MYYNELYHHGVKGQKGGVRRYQNKDGSLTKAGKEQKRNKRYSEYINPLNSQNYYKSNDQRLTPKGRELFNKYLHTIAPTWENQYNIIKKAYQDVDKQMSDQHKKYSNREEYDKAVEDIMDTKMDDLIKEIKNDPYFIEGQKFAKQYNMDKWSNSSLLDDAKENAEWYRMDESYKRWEALPEERYEVNDKRWASL